MDFEKLNNTDKEKDLESVNKKSISVYLLLITLIVIAGYIFYVNLGEINSFPFERNGDIWIAYNNGEEISRVTEHKNVKFKFLSKPFYCSSDCDSEIEEYDLNNKYNSSPQLNHNNEFIAYSCLSEETLEIIKERQSIPVSQFPDPDPMNQFYPEYDLCITSVVNKENRQVLTIEGDPYAIEWAPNSNKIAILSSIGQLFLINQDSSENFTIEKNIDYRLGSFRKNINWSPDERYLLIPSASARQVSTGRQNASTLLVFDINNEEYIDIPKNSSTHFVFMGDWINESTIMFPHREQISDDGMNVSKTNIKNFDSEIVFKDDNFNWFGFVDISPSGTYTVYPSGSSNTTSINVDLTVRNLSDKKTYLLSSLLPQSKDKDYRIEDHKWIQKDRLIFSVFSISDQNERSLSEIWSLNPETKEVQMILDNAHL